MEDGLSGAELARVFPFIIACDEQLRIRALGPSLDKLAPSLRGGALNEVARVVRPAGGLDPKQVQKEGSVFVVLEFTDPSVVLRGQALSRRDGILLLVSPWLTNPHQIERYGLSSSDFAEHDPAADYASLLHSKNSALSSALALSQQLREATRAAEQLAEQREVISARLEALIARLPFGLLVEDEHGHIAFTNERYLAAFGLERRPAELIGQHSLVANAGASACFADPSRFVANAEARARARTPVISETLTLKDGRTFERDYVPIFDTNAFRGNLWLYRDVTQQRRAALALSDARDRAEVASAAKTRFLAMMSHEIRTPLAAIVGLADLLQGGATEEQQSDLVGRLGRNARHLIELLGDILDFAKIEAGEVHVFQNVIEPRVVSREALETVSARAFEKGLETHVEIDDDVPGYVHGDATRLRQVLVNLLSNAVKFTATGSVHLRVSLRVQQGEHVTLVYEVSDTGRGIAKEAHERIFERFVRVTQVDGDYVPGTGLGLSIVKGLVSLMGGTVELESQLKQGATFRVAIPHKTVSKEQARRSSVRVLRASHSPPSCARLLLLEDDDDNRAVMHAVLEQAGHRVDTGRDGAEGLHKAMRFAYDLVLTDLQMPTVDGITFARQLRSHEQQTGTPRTPIVAVTAHAISEFKSRALAAGIDDFATKPVTAQVLAGVVQQWADMRPVVVAVDDSPDNLLVLRQTLGRTQSVRLLTVSTGEDLLTLTEQRPVKLALLDMNLPGMSGYEIAQRLRSRPETKNLPIIALTASSDNAEAERARLAGCNLFLTKPVGPKLLERVVAKLLTQEEHPVAITIGSSAERPAVMAKEAPAYLKRREQALEAVLLHLSTPTTEAIREATRLAHTTKGSGGAYGFPWLTEAAGRLEQSLVDGNLDEARALATKLLAHVRERGSKVRS